MELLTKNELEQLEGRLAALIANRPVLSQRIAEARAHGDLRENGDYHAARDQQGLEEAEIRRIEQRLAQTSVVSDHSHKSAGIVFIGATVRLHEDGCSEAELFRLVGEFSGAESEEITEVTATSPMGEALMKARVGEVVSVRTPRGVKKFRIVEIV